MKVVINKCYGGYSLSRKAVTRQAELEGKTAYFFTHTYDKDNMTVWVPAKKHDPSKGLDLFVTAFDIPNPNEALGSKKNWRDMTDAERVEHNDLYSKHFLDFRPKDRTSSNLIRVVEELGEEANGPCAKLAVVEIPDGVKFEISEYDGLEHIAEVHRIW